MKRIVIVTGPPELEAHPDLRAWAHLLLHRLLAFDLWRTEVYGRMSNPAELWAHHMARTCGHHVTDYRLDGVRWSTREEITEWCYGGEATLYEASQQLAFVVDHYLGLGSIVELHQLVIEGVEYHDPLVPMLERLGVRVVSEMAPMPPGFGGFGGLVPCWP
ncbi:MAG: hypothetical protein EOO74_07745 [Myxococcales bacterium]|nr:MAG: hypothetical protein EOO74_07745 [Myxococcales bacterium]